MLRAERLYGRRKSGRGKQRGFTLFEMVVSISSIVILYMVAEQRLNDLPAAAERASFLGVLEQIRTGVNLRMVSLLTRGEGKQSIDSVNPMEFLLERPSNYLGEQPEVTDALRRRNAWYFETSTGQLVYLVGGSSIDDVFVTVASVPVNLGQIRFRVESVYTDKSGRQFTGQEAAGQPGLRWEGVRLKPVYDYVWDDSFQIPEALEAVEAQDPVTGQQGG